MVKNEKKLEFQLFYFCYFCSIFTPWQEGYCNHNVCRRRMSINILVNTIALPFSSDFDKIFKIAFLCIKD